MNPVKWYLGAVGTLALSVITIMIGMTLLPPAAVATKKGTYIPWVATWGMVAITALAGVIVACYMVMYASSKGRSD